MDEKEYGIKLDLDLSKFNTKLAKAKQSITNLQKQTERKVKISGVDGLKEVKVKVNTKEADKALEKLKSAKERIESGEIKITGLDSDTQKMQFRNMQEVLEWQEKVKKMQRPQPISQQEQQFYGYDKDITEAVFGSDDAEQINQNIDSVKQGMNDLGAVAQSTGSKFGLFVQAVKISVKNTKEKVGNMAKDFKKLTMPVTKAINGLKKYAGALIGVYSAYRVLTRAVSSYMSFDSDLQEKVQDTWAGLGSFFAPVLEYIIDLFQQFLAYLNAVVKVFTGIDFIARANAKSMESQAKATAKANKALATFDELQNINQQSQAKQIELPSVDIGEAGDFLELLKSKFKDGKWYELGEILGNKLTEMVKSINWESIRSKTNKFSEGFARFINGAIAGTDWAVITANLSEAIITMIEFVSTFIQTINWQKVGSSIVKALEGIEWSEVVKAVISLIASAWGATLGFWWGVIKQIAIDVKESLVKNFTDEETGEVTIESILDGIIRGLVNIGTWVVDNIYTPFKNAFRKAFGLDGGEIKGVSKDGEDLAHSLFDGAKSRARTEIPEYANEIKKATDSNMKGVDKNSTTWGEKIGTGFVWALKLALLPMREINIYNIMKPVFNGLISLINTMINRINNKLNISISGTIASILKNLGVSIVGGKYQLFSMPTIPALSVGTDMVKSEGYAYLHSGEKVVPADVVKGGYTGNNEETNSLLRELIETIEEKDYKPYITIDDIGKASVKYIKNKSDVLGEALI